MEIDSLSCGIVTDLFGEISDGGRRTTAENDCMYLFSSRTLYNRKLLMADIEI